MRAVNRVAVIGLDGFDPRIAETLLDAGQLPSLAAIRQQGGYSRVSTTYPAQTPVAWSTFATGTNPGGHGIFDFVRRDPKTYLPDLSLTRYEQRSSFLPPKVVNRRGGTPVWRVLSDHGVSSTILRSPCTFPPDSIRGRMLAGMGVPDLRGGLGTSTFYSSDAAQARESERVVAVQPDPGGTVLTHLVGPRSGRDGSDLRFPVTLQVELAAKRVMLRSDGEPKILEVREGQWSDWLRVRFKTGLLQSVSGVVRFFLVRLAPVFELYASPVNFDPAAPMFQISHPPDYARELAEKVGTFYTTGMVEDHGGLNNGRFDEAAFLDQCEGVLRERERMMAYELERFDAGLFFCLFDTPDRVQHMFWRFREPDHPANRASVAPALARVIDEHYRACDALVGRALQPADDRTLAIVLSDHGMSSFWSGVHVNSWLYDNGFLALQKGAQPGEDAGEFFRAVDWSRTRAYALGLGGIYLNLAGREERGIVSGDEAEAVKTAIVGGLTGLPDRARGRVAIRGVARREQLYRGPYAEEAPDLLVNFAEGYRVSWTTALGGVPAGQLEDNDRKWSGDHLMDPALVPGVLFMNRPFDGQRAGLVDLAPTILAALGIPKPDGMEGSSLLR